MKLFTLSLIGVFWLTMVIVLTIPLVMFSAYVGQDIWIMFVLPTFGLPAPPGLDLGGSVPFHENHDRNSIRYRQGR